MKINGWNMSPWRFGSDDFPLYMGDFFGSTLIFQGVSGDPDVGRHVFLLGENVWEFQLKNI